MSLPPQITQIVQNYPRSITRSIVFGGGLAYAVSNGYWHHTPLILFSPVAYAAYQTFMSQALVIDWCKQLLS